MLLQHALREGAAKCPVQRRRMQQERLWLQRAEVCMQSSRASLNATFFCTTPDAASGYAHARRTSVSGGECCNRGNSVITALKE